MTFQKNNEEWNNPKSIATQFKKGQKIRLGIPRPDLLIRNKSEKMRNIVKERHLKNATFINCKSCNKKVRVLKCLNRKFCSRKCSNIYNTKIRIQKVKELYLKYPERHPNFILAKQGKISKPQIELFNKLKQEFPDAELNYPIITKQRTRFADVGIPSLKIDYEYDGSYWHQNKEKDRIRDEEIKEVGWKIIRIGDA